ncbi:hypothetical protein SynBIOSE41_01023 [Synechococcus sp. BIOS-E4-1]|nr:hypothetical protein SynBIOSE41_01023 [Synechococcus sp. BIOS-E4-1]
MKGQIHALLRLRASRLLALASSAGNACEHGSAKADDNLYLFQWLS